MYVLRCQHSTYYVGRCRETALDERLSQHWAGTGAAWTRMHAPLEVVRLQPTREPLDEDTVTLQQMREHGCANGEPTAASQRTDSTALV